MSGIVLLGTPHLGSNEAEIMDKICMILELAIKEPPKPLVGRVAEEIAFYPDLSNSFEGFSCRTPILSVYEVETRIREGPFSRNTHVVGSPKPLSTSAGL